MGAHLAALLNSEYASGLATAALLTQDVTDTPLIPVDGVIPVGRVETNVYRTQHLDADEVQKDAWLKRLNRCLAITA
jgi:O-succinylbenzoate synthase